MRKEDLNAKIQRLPTNPTNTLKLNDYRKNKKCAITDFSPKRHIFLFQKLGCNIEKPLHCSFSTVFDKKKKTDYSIKIFSLICERSYILIEFYPRGAFCI